MAKIPSGKLEPLIRVDSTNQQLSWLAGWRLLAASPASTQHQTENIHRVKFVLASAAVAAVSRCFTPLIRAAGIIHAYTTEDSAFVCTCLLQKKIII